MIITVFAIFATIGLIVLISFTMFVCYERGQRNHALNMENEINLAENQEQPYHPCGVNMQEAIIRLKRVAKEEKFGEEIN